MTRRLPLWIDLRGVPVNKRLPYLKTALDEEVDGLLLTKGDAHVARKGTPTIVVGADGQLRQKGKRIGRLIDVTDAATQEKAAQAKGVVVVDAKRWRVIPLENLIAARRDRPGTLYALARSHDDITLFANTLETGVHGIVLAPPGPAAIREAVAYLDARSSGPGAGKTAVPTAGAVKRAGLSDAATRTKPNGPSKAAANTTLLTTATITAVEDAGLGDRVCIDTTSALVPGEGMLVGSTARSFILVHAETTESEFVRARPFRVNAGALHMYVLAPDGRTRYLSELAAGTSALVVRRDGKTRNVTIGRAKVERRPHTMVRWTTLRGGEGMAVLQTAETVRLVRPDGKTVSITDVKVHDQVLAHDESAARHFGMPVDAGLVER